MPGRWEHSNRRAELPADWPARRAKVRARAGGRCEVVEGGVRCPARGAECDHVIRGQDHRLSNLQWICPGHHSTKTRAEAAEARGAQPKTTRPPEVHPALR